MQPPPQHPHAQHPHVQHPHAHAQHPHAPAFPHAPHGIAHANVAAGKRRPGLIAVGVLLVLGGCAGAFVASVWQEYVDSRGEEARAAEGEADSALERMQYNDDKRPMEAREEFRSKRDSLREAETARNASAGGALVGLVGGVALIVVGARARPA